MKISRIGLDLFSVRFVYVRFLSHIFFAFETRIKESQSIELLGQKTHKKHLRPFPNSTSAAQCGQLHDEVAKCGKRRCRGGVEGDDVKLGAHRELH